MVGKDQVVGFVLLIVCVVAAVGYTATLFYPQWLVMVGFVDTITSVQFWLIAASVLIGLAVAVYMGVWYGCIKATGMPPRLIERILSPIKKLKKNSKGT